MDALTVMTWNVRYFGQKTGGLRATQRCMNEIAAGIAGMDPVPDVLALQEVEDRSLRGGLSSVGQLDRFRGALHTALHAAGSPHRYQARYFPAHRYGPAITPPLYTTGLALLINEDITIEHAEAEEITAVRLPLFGKLKQKRIAVHARLSRGEQRLDLFNTHLSLPAFFEGSPHTVPARMGAGSNQLTEIRAVLAMMARREEVLPTVVVGDLNSLPGSPVHQALLDAGLSDIFSDHGTLSTARFAHLRMHLDHVFATPEMAWSDCVVPGEPLASLSDHCPKVGRITRLR
ncbi:MAG: endonuclease/exonuclease/phosphatase family protein [Myxococcota bacterium]|nr:endonuclease/exonuclease/phosphatase family protein [Myxococcota bacterium]